jgi:hypothetical protein
MSGRPYSCIQRQRRMLQIANDAASASSGTRPCRHASSGCGSPVVCRVARALVADTAIARTGTANRTRFEVYRHRDREPPGLLLRRPQGTAHSSAQHGILGVRPISSVGQAETGAHASPGIASASRSSPASSQGDESQKNAALDRRSSGRPPKQPPTSRLTDCPFGHMQRRVTGGARTRGMTIAGLCRGGFPVPLIARCASAGIVSYGLSAG